MSRHTISAYMMAALALALAACSSDSKKDAEPEPNILPTNYKLEVIETLTRTLDDPTNVREAAISEPDTLPRPPRTTIEKALAVSGPTL